MKNKLLELWDAYWERRKITLPVTIVVAGLVIGGIGYGISASGKKEAAPKEAKAKTEKVVTPEYICYDKAGTYSDKATYDAGEITVSDVTVENATFNTLTITEGVGEGSVTLNNDNVKKILVVNGGGTNSLHINGGEYDEIVSNKYNCHIVIDENCSVEKLTVPSSALVEVNGTVKTANVVPSTYDGEITWETGFKAGEKATITALNISEEVKDDVSVEDASGNAVKEEKTLTKEQTANVQANVQKVTTTAQSNSSAAKNEATSGGSNTSASASTSTPSNNGGNTNAPSNNSTPSTNNNVAPTPSTPSTPSNNNGSSNEPQWVTCPECGDTYQSGTNHKCQTFTCTVCGETYPRSKTHNCQYTKDAYGNVVRKDSRYVVAVGNYDIKKYSDGSYDVPQSARDTLASSYESEKYAYGDNWVNNPRLASIDAWCISCSGI